MTKLYWHGAFETEIGNKLKVIKFVPLRLQGNQARLSHNYFYLNACFLAHTRSVYRPIYLVHNSDNSLSLHTPKISP